MLIDDDSDLNEVVFEEEFFPRFAELFSAEGAFLVSS